MTNKTKEVKRAFKFRFYPTPDQEHILLRTWGAVRLVYNKALEERHRAWYERQENVSYADTSAMLSKWRNSEELGFLSETSSVPQQQSLRHLQKAYSNFWAKRAGYPKFKSRRKSNLSLEYSKSGFRFKDGQLFLAKMSEPLDMVVSRPFPEDTASTVTISQNKAGQWFVSILCEDTVTELPKTGESVGVDLGVKDAVVLSTGEKINPPKRSVERAERKILRDQKRLSKKVRGSKNWEKARLKLARSHQELSDIKELWLHETTTDLVRRFDMIALEDLNVRGMTASAKGTKEKPGKNVRQKAGLNRGILSNNLGEFRRMVEYKSDWYGKDAVVIDRFYPSTKTCSVCSTINTRLTLRDRVWVCEQCGSEHDRDINAAKNIEAAGRAVLVCGV